MRRLSACGSGRHRSWPQRRVSVVDARAGAGGPGCGSGAAAGRRAGGRSAVRAGAVRAAGPRAGAACAGGGGRLPALQAAPGPRPARRAAARAGLRHRQHRRAVGCQDWPVCVRGGCGAGPRSRTGQALPVGGNVWRGRVGQRPADRRGRPAPPARGTCHPHRPPRRAALRLRVRRSAGGLARGTAPAACHRGGSVAGHPADRPEDRGSAGPAGRGGTGSPGADRPQRRAGRTGGFHRFRHAVAVDPRGCVRRQNRAAGLVCAAPARARRCRRLFPAPRQR